MTPEQWQQVKELFHSALERQPCERAAFLSATCPNDDTVKDEVASLLAALNDNGAELEELPAEIALKILSHYESTQSQRIGPYKILHEIGKGGMGVVYLATRADNQFEKQVAIKLIKRGFDTDSILRRFLNERQILARLEHQNIARLLDGGITEDGLPYFVMEYIDGETLTKYCNDRKLSVAQRLELFRLICHAVHYAHKNLVVHRDIKPTNILVGNDGVPKLLDFGIAKLLSMEYDAQAPALTETAHRVMTPDYASPEQAQGEPVTTASDIYSLGVLLYELLTGDKPYHFKSRLPQEIERVICEQQPERPSSIVKLAADLDIIILKAMHKDPARRYASAHQLSEDIRLHLTGLPITAHADDLFYRFGKFIKRHKIVVTATLVGLTALIMGLFIAIWQARIAQAQRQIAESERLKTERLFNDIRILSNSLLFEFHDSIRTLPGSTQARELLIKRTLEYLDSLATEAGTNPLVQKELAAAYEKLGELQSNRYDANLGDTAGALASYRKSLAMREALNAAQPHSKEGQFDLAKSYKNLGELLVNAGDSAAALHSFRMGLEIIERLAADPAFAHARYELPLEYIKQGDLLVYTGNQSEAAAYFLKAFNSAEELYRANPTDKQVKITLISCVKKFAMSQWTNGDAAQALELMRRAVSLSEQLQAQAQWRGEYRNTILSSYKSLGDLLLWSNDLAGAFSYYQKTLMLVEEMASLDPANAQARRFLIALNDDIGNVEFEAGEWAAALKSFRKAFTVQEELCVRDPLNTRHRRDLAHFSNKIGRIYMELGKNRSAASFFRKAMEIQRELTRRDPANVQVQADYGMNLYYLATLLARTGEPAAAKEYTVRALAIMHKLADRPDALLQDLYGYSLVLLSCEPAAMRDPESALPYVDRAVKLTKGKHAAILKLLSLTLYQLGHYRRAIQAAEQALALMPATNGSARKPQLQRELEDHLKKIRRAAKPR